MKQMIGILFALAMTTPVFAGVQGFNGTTNLGVFPSLKCSTGLSCSKVGDKMVFTVAQPTFTLANGEIINNTVDDTVEVLSDDSDTTFQITGFEAKDAILNLYADQGDDAADKWSLLSDHTANGLQFRNNAVAKFSLSSAGVITLADSETLTNASDVLTLLSDDNDGKFAIQGFEAKDAILLLQADESDDSGDDWQIKAAASGNALSISNDTSGSQVAKLTISTAGAVQFVGDISGYQSPLVAATATTISQSQCGSTFYNTGAISINLPEASTALGCTLTFVTLNASNFDINPDDADKILTLTDAAGDSIRNATVGNSVSLRAVSASQWALVSKENGTWSDIN